MNDIIRDAHSRFTEISRLLQAEAGGEQSYFLHLSEATQNAYVVMNEGMCENTTVCHECAAHRDFLQSMIGIVEDLASGAPLSAAYQTALESYRRKVGEILTKIEGAIASM